MIKSCITLHVYGKGIHDEHYTVPLRAVNYENFLRKPYCFNELHWLVKYYSYDFSFLSGVFIRSKNHHVKF
jgi:hypothetical protein